MSARRWGLPGRAADASPVGIVIAGGVVLVVAAALVSAAVPATAPGVRLGVFAVALVGFAALAVDPVATAAVTGMAALVFNGFLVNQLGELSWHGAADAGRLALLVAAAVTGFAAGTGYRWVRRARLWRARHQQVARWVADAQVDLEPGRPVHSEWPRPVRRSRTVSGRRERGDG